MMKHLQSTTDQARVFLYDADDERVMTYDCAQVECETQSGRLTTTVRGLDGKVLRIYRHDLRSTWSWLRDYVYRDGQLLAAVEPDETSGEVTKHFHLDHLGSPRQITDGGAAQVAFHTYYPFGAEATDPGQDEVELKFTGHERDANGSAGAGMLDYMHARYYNPLSGRFLSVDPANSASPARSQSWNRYSYVRNNPLRSIDPDGLLQRDVNGELVVELGEVSGRMHRGSADPTTQYRVQDVTLFADDGTPVRAHTVLSGTAGVGDIRSRSEGIRSVPDATNPLCTNCHGIAFADGKYWIENNQIDQLLKGDGYRLITGEAQVGDVVIYRHKGKVVHSATVASVGDDGQVLEVNSLGGLDTEPAILPVGPGEGTAWEDWIEDVFVYRYGARE